MPRTEAVSTVMPTAPSADRVGRVAITSVCLIVEAGLTGSNRRSRPSNGGSKHEESTERPRDYCGARDRRTGFGTAYWPWPDRTNGYQTSIRSAGSAPPLRCTTHRMCFLTRRRHSGEQPSCQRLHRSPRCPLRSRRSHVSSANETERCTDGRGPP